MRRSTPQVRSPGAAWGMVRPRRRLRRTAAIRLFRSQGSRPRTTGGLLARHQRTAQNRSLRPKSVPVFLEAAWRSIPDGQTTPQGPKPTYSRSTEVNHPKAPFQGRNATTIQLLLRHRALIQSSGESAFEGPLPGKNPIGFVLELHQPVCCFPLTGSRSRTLFPGRAQDNRAFFL